MKLEDITEAKETLRQRLGKKYGITKFVGSTGLNEEKGIWYGWSHRAIQGFEIGDKIFEANFGGENTDFRQHGKKPVRTLDDAKLAAERFSKYVS
jgi:hypothetical protein